MKGGPAFKEFDEIRGGKHAKTEPTSAADREV
jgi:hypothetical protein